MFLTDGAISPDGNQVALRSYTSLFLYDAEAFLRNGTDGDAGVVYPLPLQPQGETLAYTPDGRAACSSAPRVSTSRSTRSALPQKSGAAAPSPPATSESSGASVGVGAGRHPGSQRSGSRW